MPSTIFSEGQNARPPTERTTNRQRHDSTFENVTHRFGRFSQYSLFSATDHPHQAQSLHKARLRIRHASHGARLLHCHAGACNWRMTTEYNSLLGWDNVAMEFLRQVTDDSRVQNGFLSEPPRRLDRWTFVAFGSVRRRGVRLAIAPHLPPHLLVLRELSLVIARIMSEDRAL